MIWAGLFVGLAIYFPQWWVEAFCCWMAAAIMIGAVLGIER